MWIWNNPENFWIGGLSPAYMHWGMQGAEGDKYSGKSLDYCGRGVKSWMGPWDLKQPSAYVLSE